MNKFLSRKIKLKNAIQSFGVSNIIIKNENHSVELKVLKSRASDISRKKRQNFAGFSGPNSRKNRPISRDFRGKKVKIRSKIGRFRGILAENSQISNDFQGQILRKISRFRGKFRGETSPRNNQ